MTDDLKFIVDHNVGKLAHWLRMMGYDTLFFNGDDDSQMVATARKEKRIILTRDTQIMERRVVKNGQVSALLIAGDEPEVQMRQVITVFQLNPEFKPFTICLECNQPLLKKAKTEVADQVPAYVFRTQQQYMACPRCHRIYWRGTHWEAMKERLKGFSSPSLKD